MKLEYWSRKKFIFSVIGIVLVYVIITIYSDISEISKIFQNIKTEYLISMLGLTVFSVLIRSVIQRFLLKEIGIQLSLKESFTLFLASFSMLITPGGVGILIKSYFIKQKYGHSISKTIPLVLGERFFDFLGMVMVVIFTLFFIFALESFIIILISSIILVGILFITRNKKSLLTFKNFVKKIKFLNNLMRDDSEFYSSLNIIFGNKILTIVGLSIVALSFFDGMIFYFGFLAFDVDLGYIQSVQSFFTSILYAAISFIPAGVGVAEGSFIAILTSKNISLSLATSIMLINRFSTLWFMTAVGFFTWFFVLQRNND